MKNCLLNLKRRFGNNIGTFIYVAILFAINVWPSLLAIYLCKRGLFIWACAFIFLIYWISAVLTALSGNLGGNLSERYSLKDTDGTILIKDAGDGTAHILIETKGIDELVKHKYCILEVHECNDSETFNDYI